MHGRPDRPSRCHTTHSPTHFSPRLLCKSFLHQTQIITQTVVNDLRRLDDNFAILDEFCTFIRPQALQPKDVIPDRGALAKQNRRCAHEASRETARNASVPVTIEPTGVETGNLPIG